MDHPVFAMYRDAVDQAMRDDIATAAAVHRELGRDYDDAVAEGLVDRIGAEIDKRIQARLPAAQPTSRSPEESSRSGRSQAMWIGAGLGTGITGLVAMVANQGNSGPNSNAVVMAVIAVWVILAIGALGRAFVGKNRD